MTALSPGNGEKGTPKCAHCGQRIIRQDGRRWVHYLGGSALCQGTTRADAHRITRRRAPDSFRQPADSAACEDCAWTCVASPSIVAAAVVEHRKAAATGKPTCPRCGRVGRNTYRKGELWDSCKDPWHDGAES